MLYQSTPIDSPSSGSHTPPIEYCVDFSGLSAVLPPWTFTNCVTQSFTWSLVIGQRTGSESPGCVLVVTCGENSSGSAGARKPVPYDARARNCLVGCQRSDSFGLVVEPKSL
jgi:hypothetical protein